MKKSTVLLMVVVIALVLASLLGGMNDGGPYLSRLLA